MSRRARARRSARVEEAVHERPDVGGAVGEEERQLAALSEAGLTLADPAWMTGPESAWRDIEQARTWARRALPRQRSVGLPHAGGGVAPFGCDQRSASLTSVVVSSPDRGPTDRGLVRCGLPTTGPATVEAALGAERTSIRPPDRPIRSTHVEQSVARGFRLRLGIEPGSVVADRELEPPVGLDEPDDDRRAGRVLGCVAAASRRQKNNVDSISAGNRRPGDSPATTDTALAPANSASDPQRVPALSAEPTGPRRRSRRAPPRWYPACAQELQTLNRGLEAAALHVELDQTEHEPKGHQVMLDAVVQIALDAAAFRVHLGHGSTAGAGDLGGVRESRRS